jgi:pullulanase
MIEQSKDNGDLAGKDARPASVIFAVADSPGTVTALLSGPPDNYGAFALYENDKKIPGKAARGKAAREVIITLEKAITDPAKYYVVRDESGFYADRALTMRNILDHFTCADDDLGLNCGPRESRFKVWAPTAAAVSVELYSSGDGEPGGTEGGEKPRLYRMNREPAAGLWQALIPGDLRGLYYLYRVELPDGTVNRAVDPYARAVGVNGRRGMVIDPASTDPPGFREEPRPSLAAPVDAVIYELHLRDLSIHPRSGIIHKGKFLGLAETGAKTAGGLSAGLDHIRELGVTHVHLLPGFDFKTIDEADQSRPQFNWGYDPLNYNAPEGSYATDPFDGAARLREFKTAIQTLHRHGLGLIMDVVYNHTYNAEDSWFSALVPGYYYRTDEAGRYTDGSACGNETASERFMMGKFIVDSVCYWAREYRIDGFRFDLMGLHDIDTINAVRRELDRIDPSIIVYGEGWVARDSPLPVSRRAIKANAPRLDERIAVFSDDIRDGIKGSVFYAAQGGFVNGGYADKDRDGTGGGAAKTPDFRVEDVKFGVPGAVEHPQIDLGRVHYSDTFWARAPGQAVNYVSAHDNLTLWDKLAATKPGAGEDELIRMNKLAAAIVLTSQGIPFFQAGEEMARTKGGDDNSYKSPDAVNALDWDRKSRFTSLTAYYRGLITLRKTYRAFRLRRAEDIRQRLRFLPNPASPGPAAERPLIAYTLENGAGDKYARFTLVFNGGLEETAISIPPGDWEVLVNGENAGPGPLGHVSGGSLRVPGQTAFVLGQRP